MPPRSYALSAVLAWLLVGLATAAAPPALAAPRVTIKARTDVRLDPIQRSFGGVAIRGTLVDRASGEPIPWAPVDVEVDGAVQSQQTDDAGRFEVIFFLPEGRHDLRVSFAGDTHLTATAFELGGFDVAKEPLEITVGVEGRPTLSDESVRVVVKTSAPGGAAEARVALLAGPADAATLTPVGEIATDDTGRGQLDIPLSALGGPGRKRVRAVFAGDGAFNPSEAAADFQLDSETSTTLAIADRDLAFEDDLLARGRVVDETGVGVPGAAVVVSVLGRRLGEVLTDADGNYRASIPAAELGAGEHNVEAAFEPAARWLRDSRAKPVMVAVATPQPVPISYTLAAFVITALAMVGFLALRTQPWKRWLARLRRRGAADDEVERPAEPGAVVRHGLREARPSLVSSLRRAHDHGFTGVVRDAVTGRGIADAHIEIVAHGDTEATWAGRTGAGGAFAREELAAGGHAVTVIAPGYCRERFSITVPHRGELRGARVDLLAVRERIFAIYREAAQPLLPEPGLWGVWTPREIVEHVRSRRPAGALASLTDFVEEAYFSQRTPHEQLLAEAESRTRAAVAEQIGP